MFPLLQSGETRKVKKTNTLRREQTRQTVEFSTKRVALIRQAIRKRTYTSSQSAETQKQSEATMANLMIKAEIFSGS